MTQAIQIVEHAKDQADAQEMLDALALQDGHLGGRILSPSPAEPTWRVQAFTEHPGGRVEWLPDGMREVLILDSQRAYFGVTGE